MPVERPRPTRLPWVSRPARLTPSTRPSPVSPRPQSSFTVGSMSALQTGVATMPGAIVPGQLDDQGDAQAPLVEPALPLSERGVDRGRRVRAFARRESAVVAGEDDDRPLGEPQLPRPWRRSGRRSHRRFRASPRRSGSPGGRAACRPTSGTSRPGPPSRSSGYGRRNAAGTGRRADPGSSSMNLLGLGRQAVGQVLALGASSRPGMVRPFFENGAM